MSTLSMKTCCPKYWNPWAHSKTAKRADIQAELQKGTESAIQLAIPPETSPKLQELRQRLSETADVAAVEGEVFSHLYNFFRRYYDSEVAFHAPIVMYTRVANARLGLRMSQKTSFSRRVLEPQKLRSWLVPGYLALI